MWEARILFGIGYLHKDIGGEGRGGGVIGVKKEI
jgi:hypothetical protein